jgi:hypothetical protein
VCGPDGLLHTFIAIGDGGVTATTHAAVPMTADEDGVTPAGGTSEGAVTVASTAPVALYPGALSYFRASCSAWASLIMPVMAVAGSRYRSVG